MIHAREATSVPSRGFLFVHCSPGDARMFQPLLDRAPSDARLVWLDLPDHGQARDELSMSWEPFDGAVLSAAERFQSPFTLVGHSLGAFLAARLLPRLGAKVGRCVLISGFVALPREVRDGYLQLLTQLRTGALEVSAVRDAMVPAMLGARHAAPDHERLVRGVLADVPPERFMRGIERVATLLGDPNAVSPFDVPTQLIHARGDGAVPYACGLDLAERASAGQLATLDSDSHAPILTHLGEVTPLVYEHH